MRNPYWGKWCTDDDSADLPRDSAPLGGWAWDLRDEAPPPWEEAPVITYRLSPEEIAARYGPPQPRQQVRDLAGVAYQTKRPRAPMLPMTRTVLRELAAQGLTAEEIAQRLNRTVRAVKMRAKKWGIELAESPNGQG